MSNEIKKTPRNKIRAEQQFAAQIAGSGLTSEGFIIRAKNDGILYLGNDDAHVCSQTYTKADAPETFGWFLSIIESLTIIQINESTPVTCPVSVDLPTESSLLLTPLPTQNTEPSPTEAPMVPPTSSVPSNSPDVLVPTSNPSPEPTSGNRQETLPTEPTGDPQPSLDTSNTTVLPTEEPASSNFTTLQNETEASPKENVSDTGMKPNNSHKSFFETVPFTAIAATAGAMVVGLIMIGGYFWKQKMARTGHPVSPDLGPESPEAKGFCKLIQSIIANQMARDETVVQEGEDSFSNHNSVSRQDSQGYGSGSVNIVGSDSDLDLQLDLEEVDLNV